MTAYQENILTVNIKKSLYHLFRSHQTENMMILKKGDTKCKLEIHKRTKPRTKELERNVLLKYIYIKK